MARVAIRNAEALRHLAAAALAGCTISAPPFVPGGVSDGGLADGSSTGDGSNTAAAEGGVLADAAPDAGGGICGCGRAPICGEACQSACGCCSCLPGEQIVVNGSAFQCSSDTSCFRPALIDGAAE
jgi:hypothetical protein